MRDEMQENKLEGLHAKFRLELILESPALRRAEDILEEAGVSGWTVIPAKSGFDGRQRWSRGTDISAATDMIVLICVGDADIIPPVLPKLHSLLKRHIGVLNIMPVQVLRNAEF
jgi:PII-like signaling protein